MSLQWNDLVNIRIASIVKLPQNLWKNLIKTWLAYDDLIFTQVLRRFIQVKWFWEFQYHFNAVVDFLTIKVKLPSMQCSKVQCPASLFIQIWSISLVPEKRCIRYGWKPKAWTKKVGQENIKYQRRKIQQSLYCIRYSIGLLLCINICAVTFTLLSVSPFNTFLRIAYFHVKLNVSNIEKE